MGNSNPLSRPGSKLDKAGETTHEVTKICLFYITKQTDWHKDKPNREGGDWVTATTYNTPVRPGKLNLIDDPTLHPRFLQRERPVQRGWKDNMLSLKLCWEKQGLQ